MQLEGRRRMRVCVNASPVPGKPSPLACTAQRPGNRSSGLRLRLRLGLRLRLWLRRRCGVLLLRKHNHRVAIKGASSSEQSARELGLAQRSAKRGASDAPARAAAAFWSGRRASRPGRSRAPVPEPQAGLGREPGPERWAALEPGQRRAEHRCTPRRSSKGTARPAPACRGRSLSTTARHVLRRPSRLST